MATQSARAAKRATTARHRVARASGARAAATTRKVTVPAVEPTADGKVAGVKPRRAPSGGSPRLADTLTALLAEVGREVSSVTALSAAIDEAARGLQEQLAEYVDRMATLSRLRGAVPGGTLAAFLDETLVPQRPTELELLADRTTAARNATI